MALERAYTVKETASLMRMSARQLHDLVKRYPFYYSNGNRKIFTEGDITRLRNALSGDAGSSPLPNRVYQQRAMPKGAAWAYVQSELARLGVTPKCARRKRA